MTQSAFGEDAFGRHSEGSLQAAHAAPLILLAQTRQDKELTESVAALTREIHAAVRHA